MRIFFLLAMLLSPAAFSYEVDLRRLPYQALFEETSAEGESLESFLLRVGPKLRAYSNETGLEACGSIAQGQGKYGIVVGTSKSHLGCAIYHRKVPAGMTSLGKGIHSHGGVQEFRQNQADRIFRGVPDDARSINNSRVYGQDINAFSDVDKAAGEIYLAAEQGVLLYKNGQTSVVVAPVATMAVAQN